MIEEIRSTAVPEKDDFVRFWAAGDRAKGEYHCSECGYGVTVFTKLPVCPMCSCTTWEQSTWSPFGRTGAFSDL
jgi:rubrerythrin